VLILYDSGLGFFAVEYLEVCKDHMLAAGP